MGQRVIYVDDMDEKEYADVEPRRFSLGNQAYVIDLNTKNWDALQKALGPWLDKAKRDTGAQSAPKGVRAARGTSGGGKASNASEIRAWAAANGITVSPRGRIHGDVVKQFKEANG